MISTATLITESRRLAVLNLLADCAGYRAGAGMLHLALPSTGHAVVMDVLKADLSWLHQVELVELDDMDRAFIATLTPRGMDVANGLSMVPGVARPLP